MGSKTTQTENEEHRRIWEEANRRKELIRSINYTIHTGRGLDEYMDQLKQLMPCLYGIDPEQHVLLFQDSDSEIVAIYMKEEGDRFWLAFATNIALG